MIIITKTDSVIVAEDHFATDFIRPVKDDEQNVELLSASENNARLQVVVRRPLMTCDQQDNAIRYEYPHRLLYAFGEDGSWAVQYHGTDNRGSHDIYFTKNEAFHNQRNLLLNDKDNHI